MHQAPIEAKKSCDVTRDIRTRRRESKKTQRVEERRKKVEIRKRSVWYGE
jgi:hypothetical protein